MDKVEITSEPTGAEAPQPMEENVEQQATPEEQAEQTTEQRPEWLPEKFQSAEDLAKAYGELESKLGKTEEQTEPSAEAPSDLLGDAGDKYFDEFKQHGKLTEESINEIVKLGISKDYVEAFIAGQQAIVERDRGAIFDSVGGEEVYKSMTEWAAQNFNKEELTAYDAAVDSGDINTVMMAVKGLHARYGQVNGNAPNLIKGNAGPKGSQAAYRDVSEMIADMQKPEYKTSEAFRKDVQNRLAVSKIL